MVRKINSSSWGKPFQEPSHLRELKMVASVQSKTQERREVAEKRLPQLIESFLMGKRHLTENNLRLLYSEVRAATCNRIPKGMQAEVKDQSLDLRTKSELLASLLYPEEMTRGQIMSVFALLKSQVRHHKLVGPNV
jgi:hypothetical protein